MSPLLKNLTEEIDRLLGGEIKELKFGCEINYKTFLNGYECEDFGIISSEWDLYRSFVIVKSNPVIIPIRNEDIIEILGRPITLEDVMRAINAVNRTKGIYPPELFSIGSDKSWQLGKPLSSQSEDTIKSIAEILGVK